RDAPRRSPPRTGLNSAWPQECEDHRKALRPMGQSSSATACYECAQGLGCVRYRQQKAPPKATAENTDGVSRKSILTGKTDFSLPSEASGARGARRSPVHAGCDSRVCATCRSPKIDRHNEIDFSTS